MARTMADGDLPWAEIQPLYEDRAMSVAELAARYGMTGPELTHHAIGRRWKLRSETRKKPLAQKRGAAASSRAKPKPISKRVQAEAGEPGTAPAPGRKTAETDKTAADVHPRRLVKRIYKTIDRELTKLEDQTGKTSQDRERASRALSQMVTSLEKAVEMQREIAKDKGARSAHKDKEALKHAEELRREIAERLERLHRKRAAGQ